VVVAAVIVAHRREITERIEYAALLRVTAQRELREDLLAQMLPPVAVLGVLAECPFVPFGLAREFVRREFPRAAAESEREALAGRGGGASDTAAASEGEGDGGGSGYAPAGDVHGDLSLRPGPCDPRWCRTCRAVKPPRTHHCSMCDRCVLKMDHHCESSWGSARALARACARECRRARVSLLNLCVCSPH
jgi:hypothetical protein